MEESRSERKKREKQEEEQEDREKDEVEWFLHIGKPFGTRLQLNVEMLKCGYHSFRVASFAIRFLKQHF